MPQPPPVAELQVSWADEPDVPGMWLEIRLVALTGEAGSVEFAEPVSAWFVDGATCDTATRCTFAGVSSPNTVTIVTVSDVHHNTIVLRDSDGNVEATATVGEPAAQESGATIDAARPSR